jgi:hypothetical protein
MLVLGNNERVPSLTKAAKTFLEGLTNGCYADKSASLLVFYDNTGTGTRCYDIGEHTNAAPLINLTTSTLLHMVQNLEPLERLAVANAIAKTFAEIVVDHLQAQQMLDQMVEQGVKPN